MAPSNQDDFDGYRKWLGIANQNRLPTHYELLKISLDEDDSEVIQSAAEQRRHYIESKRGQGHDAIVTEILYVINEAEITLLNSEMRRKYDRQLKLFEKRREDRQVDPLASRSRIRSRPGKAVGEDNGVVKTFAGIVAVLVVAFAGMALFSFKVLPWSKQPEQHENVAAAQLPVPVPAPAPAQVAKAALPELPKKAAVAAQVDESNRLNFPPDGFEALFNGVDFTNWSEQNPDHWSVSGGILRYDGKGGTNKNLVSVKTYGDFELLVDWKIVPGGDSGVYLRGKPQVQIKDDAVGSGGLYNNKVHPNTPSFRVDKPAGEWNSFHIIMRGEKATVSLNGQQVVDNVTLENYPSYVGAIPSRGTIELQQHTGATEFRNIFVRELSQSSSPSTADETAVAQTSSKGEISLLEGDSLDGWQTSPPGAKSQWSLKDGLLKLNAIGPSLVTKQEFSDFNLHLEFKLPSKCNTGVYLRGRYEVQLLDADFKLQSGEPVPLVASCGAIYKQSAPLKNLYRGPNKWNAMDIQLIGRVVTVRLNDAVIIDSYTLRGVTPEALNDRESEPGPILLQSHGVPGPEFRNIRIRPVSASGIEKHEK